jgi:hypothetical protein
MNHTDVHKVFNARRQNGDGEKPGGDTANECALNFAFHSSRDKKEIESA